MPDRGPARTPRRRSAPPPGPPENPQARPGCSAGHDAYAREPPLHRVPSAHCRRQSRAADDFALFDAASGVAGAAQRQHHPEPAAATVSCEIVDGGRPSGTAIDRADQPEPALTRSLRAPKHPRRHGHPRRDAVTDRARGRIRTDCRAVAKAHGVPSRRASLNRMSDLEFRDGFREDPGMSRTSTARIGCARVSGRSQDRHLQRDALAAADSARSSWRPQHAWRPAINRRIRTAAEVATV